MTEVHLLTIIGSGPAAWTAAIYAARAGLSPIVLAGEQSGGQLMLTTKIENYPGFPDGVLGPDLITAMRRQAKKHGVKIIDKNAAKLVKTNNGFNITYGDLISKHSENSGGQKIRFSDSPTLRNSEYSEFSGKGNSVIAANSIIIATGATANTLKLPGEEKLMGRGVGTCAVCDAPLYRGKNTVFVIGGGDSAAEEAVELAKFVNKVIILVRKDTMRAGAAMYDRIKSLQNIEIWYKAEAKEFLGEKQLNRVKIVKDGKETVLPADGVFYAIGHTPATGWLKDSGIKLDEKGYIITPLSTVISPANQLSVFGSRLSDFGQSVVGQPVSETDKPKTGKPEAENRKQRTDNRYPTMTTIPGVFAAGDCVDPRYRQAITAAGFGCMAALDTQKWLGNALMR